MLLQISDYLSLAKPSAAQILIWLLSTITLLRQQSSSSALKKNLKKREQRKNKCLCANPANVLKYSYLVMLLKVDCRAQRKAPWKKLYTPNHPYWDCFLLRNRRVKRGLEPRLLRLHLPRADQLLEAALVFPISLRSAVPVWICPIGLL